MTVAVTPWRVILLVVPAIACASASSAQTAHDNASLAGITAVQPPAPPAATAVRASLKRSFIALQAAFAGFEALDTYSTLRGIHGTAAEANPLMRNAAMNPMALAAAKAGGTGATLLLTRHVARRHPKAAIALIAAMNSSMAAIAIHNLKAASR